MMFSQSFSLEIRETVKDLEGLFECYKQLDLRDKLAALYLLKLERANTCAELARIIGQDIATVELWFEVYSRQGLNGLLAV